MCLETPNVFQTSTSDVGTCPPHEMAFLGHPFGTWGLRGLKRIPFPPSFFCSFSLSSSKLEILVPFLTLLFFSPRLTSYLLGRSNSRRLSLLSGSPALSLSLQFSPAITAQLALFPTTAYVSSTNLMNLLHTWNPFTLLVRCRKKVHTYPWDTRAFLQCGFASSFCPTTPLSPYIQDPSKGHSGPSNFLE